MNKGRILKTICFPVHLAGIIDNLSEQRILSKTISELLWDMYGDEDLDFEKAVVNQMKNEAERLKKSIEIKEAEIQEKDKVKIHKNKLNYIEIWLTDNNKIWREIKNIKKNGGFYLTAENRNLKDDINDFIERYGGLDDALSLFDKVKAERNSLIEIIKNPNNNNNNNNKQITYNNNNNNNNIYSLINYNNKDISTGGQGL